jgi:hypothetical protein
MYECTKARFTKKEAEAALRKNKKSGVQYRREVRSYYCSKCNIWHLTSQEFVPPEEIVEIEVEEKEKWSHLLNN